MMRTHAALAAVDDRHRLPIGVVLLVVGATVPGIVVLVLDVLLIPVGLLLGRGGGGPGKPSQQGTEARIFED
jgi:hypothetical protein